MGIGPVIAVGHSAGAIIAMELHRRQPTRIAGLALVAPAVSANPGSIVQRMTLGGQLRLVAMRGLLAGDTTGVRYVRRQILRQRDAILKGLPGGVPHATQEVAADVVAGYLQPLKAVDWDIASLLNMRSMTMPPAYDFGSVAVPALVVQGRRDRLVDNARLLVEVLEARDNGGGTTFVELECGHVPAEEEPEAFNAALVELYSWPGDGDGGRWRLSRAVDMAVLRVTITEPGC